MNFFRKLFGRGFKKQHAFVPDNGRVMVLSAADLEKHVKIFGKPTRILPIPRQIAAEHWAETAVEHARDRVAMAHSRYPEILYAWVSCRDTIKKNVALAQVAAIREVVINAKKTGRLDTRSKWSSMAYEWLVADYAEHTLRSTQARWDARRMDRNTAPALGANKRQGRL